MLFQASETSKNQVDQWSHTAGERGIPNCIYQEVGEIRLEDIASFLGCKIKFYFTEWTFQALFSQMA